MSALEKLSEIQIGIYRWSEMSDNDKHRIMKRSSVHQGDIEKIVAPIIEDVRVRGDEALVEYGAKFDGAVFTKDQIKATDTDFEAAEARIDDELKKAIDHCVQNVRRFHQIQMNHVQKSWMVEIEDGVWAGEQVSAIPSVGLYVPRGKGAFPSSVFMLALPASIAGVADIHIVTPPTPDGGFDDATLYTAALCGVRNVYKAGGSQGIAALAYGTDTIPAVKKVLGPGSPYVQAAKKICSDVMNPGMPAGPSDSLILADKTAHVGNTILDMLNETEHGGDSSVVLVTDDMDLAQAVAAGLPAELDSLPELRRQMCIDALRDYSAIIVTENLDEAVEVSNEYAGEHVLLKVKDAENWIDKLEHAGEIAIGEYTAFSFGNFISGVNHVLPVGGLAHTYSCTSIWDYLKRTSLTLVDKDGFELLRDDLIKITDYEGFPAHGNAVSKRETNPDLLVQPPKPDEL